MALTTVADLTKFALRKLGVLKSGSAPTADEQADALDALNGMLRQWSNKKYLTGQLFRRAYTWPSATVSRTIGPTGDFVQTRPQRILGAFLTDGSSNIDYPLVMIPQEKYNAITVKQVQGIPAWLFSQITNTNSNLFLYYVPAKAYTITLDSLEPFTEYAASTDNLSLPIDYTEGIGYNLALRLSDEYGVTPTKTTIVFAADALRDIKDQRADPIPEVVVARALGVRNRYHYNINSDL
jgi:hypothetical protein